MHHRSILLAALLTILWVPTALAVDERDVLGNGKVVLVPPNLGVRAAEEVAPGVEPVWREMLVHFAAQDQPAAALERNSAAALWREVVLEVKAKPNADVYDAYALFARRIADQVEYSAIVFPSLVTRAAKLSGQTAAWDGVRRRVPNAGDSTSFVPAVGSEMVVTGMRGELAAASLHVAVLSPDGELRFEGAGGLALLQQVESAGTVSSEIDVAMRENAFADSAELREGIEAAFRRPLPASRAH